MKKDGLAVEGEGDLVQRRQVSSVMVERSNSILVWLIFGFSLLIRCQLLRYGLSILPELRAQQKRSPYDFVHYRFSSRKIDLSIFANIAL